jgi:hypothetical protein
MAGIASGTSIAATINKTTGDRRIATEKAWMRELIELYRRESPRGGPTIPGFWICGNAYE